MAAKKKTHPKPCVRWVGVVDDRIFESLDSDTYGPTSGGSWFRKRSMAAARFERFIRVQIVPIKTKRRRR